MTEYIKGDAFESMYEFAVWLSNSQPYYFENKLREQGGYCYSGFSVKYREYFRAIPKPEKKVKKLYAYIDINDDDGHVCFKAKDNILIGYLRRAHEYDIIYENN